MGDPSEQINSRPFLKRKIVLVESILPAQKLLSQNLELYTGSDIVYKKNADEVVNLLSDGLTLVDLIICDSRTHDESTALKVYYYLNSTQLEVPMIVIGESPKLETKVEVIEREEWRKVVKSAAKILNVTANKMIQLKVPQLYPFPLRGVMGLEQLPIEVFLKEDDEFVSWKKKNSNVKRDDWQKLFIQGHQSIYVDQGERLKFLSAVSESLLEELKASDKTSKDRIELTEAAFNLASAYLNEVGIDEGALKASRETIRSMNIIARSEPGIGELLEILQKDLKSKLYSHSLMIAMIGFKVIGKLEWGNKEQKEKFVFVSFFHDIVLVGDDHLCEVNCEEDLEASSFTDSEKERILGHAKKVSGMISNFPDTPFGAERIILQHHGKLNGVGFAKKGSLDSRVTPLAVTFRVVEDFVHRLMESEEKLEYTSILDQMREEFDQGAYRVSFQALIQALKG
jgi:hypothetical protein